MMSPRSSRTLLAPSCPCVRSLALLATGVSLGAVSASLADDRGGCNETGVIQISNLTGLWDRVVTTDVDPECDATAFDTAFNNVRYNGVRFYIPVNQVFVASVLSGGTTVDDPNMQLYCEFDDNNPDENLIAHDDDGGPGLLPEFFDSDSITLWAGRAYTLIFSGPEAGEESGNVNVCLGGDAKFGVPGGFQNTDQVGYSIANAGDVNGDGFDDIIIGMPQNDDTGSNAGKAAIGIQFENGFDQIYAVFGEEPGDKLGWSVSGAGDVNDDGYDEVIVGAPYNDENASNCGAAYLYTFRNGYPELLESHYGNSKNDRFGSAVAGGQDINNDDFDDYAVGAPLDDDNGNNSGTVRVISGDDASTLATLVGAEPKDEFGSAIDLVRKGNADPNADILVGAPFNDEAAEDAGKVYLVSGATFTLIYAKLGNTEGDRFGHDVASCGRVNGDNIDDFVVGSPFYDKGGQANAGRIDVYSGDTGNLIFTRKGKQANERFGWSVNCEGDLTGDDDVDIIVGAPLYDSGGLTDAGRVEIRNADGTLLISQNGNAIGGQFGYDVGGRDTPGGPIDICPLTFGTEPFNVAFNGGLKAVFICEERASLGSDNDPAWSTNLTGIARFPFELPERPVSPPRSVVTGTDDDPAGDDPRAADFNRDGVTDSRDVVLLLADWGSADSDADLNQDGTVDGLDISAIFRFLN